MEGEKGRERKRKEKKRKKTKKKNKEKRRNERRMKANLKEKESAKMNWVTRLSRKSCSAGKFEQCSSSVIFALPSGSLLPSPFLFSQMEHYSLSLRIRRHSQTQSEIDRKFRLGKHKTHATSVRHPTDEMSNRCQCQLDPLFISIETNSELIPLQEPILKRKRGPRHNHEKLHKCLYKSYHSSIVLFTKLG